MVAAIALGCVAPLGKSFSASASTDSLTPNWLSDETPVVSKVADLADGREPFSMGVDCVPTDFPTGLRNDNAPVHGCVFSNALGTLSNAYLVNGSNGTLQFDDSHSGFFLPSPPNSPNTLVTFTYPHAWSSGAALRFSNYDGKPTQHVTYWGVPLIEQYTYDLVNPVVLKDATHATIPFREDTLAYSSNGEWMTVLTDNNGIMLYNLKTFTGKLIAWTPDDLYAKGETIGASLAVSDNGRFVAANPRDADGNPTLRVYDTTTCVDQYELRASPNNCEYRDVWNGNHRNGQSGTPVRDLTNVEYPRHLRFKTNQALEFDGVHDRASADNFKVSRYQAFVTASERSAYLSLLGMGDSYISGEGAFSYRKGTDTANDKCHTSWHSYPYTRGLRYFTDVQSVACSGAKLNDIDAGLLSANREGGLELRKTYQGQVKDKKQWGKRNNSDEILNKYIPGYADQILFSDKYKPRVVLLSVGGNDIHFSDIIKQCVSPQNSESCYSTYEDRYEIMQDIVAQYDKLVAVYKDVAQSSGGSVYVVGYPQIAKPGGSCGKNVNLNNDELKFSAHLITYLNSVIKRAASSAGVFYVDNENALNGYRLCEAPKDQAAINGFTVGKDGGVKVAGKQINFVSQESYHPTAFGYSLLGNSIVTKTSNFTKPMPKPVQQDKPSVDENNPLLTDVPKSQRTPNMIVWRNTNIASPLISGSKYVLKTSTSAIAKGSSYLLVLHSTPTVLSKGIVNGQDVEVTIPASTPFGFHTLDLYGVNENGQSIDERQVVFIGTLDQLMNSPCLHIPLAGVDEDGDGVDDACDGNIINPSAEQGDPADIPVDESEFVDGADTAGAEDDSILSPYKLSSQDSQPNPTNKEAVQSKKTAQNSPSVIQLFSVAGAQGLTSMFSIQTSSDGQISVKGLATTQPSKEATTSNSNNAHKSDDRKVFFRIGIVLLAIIILSILLVWGRRKSATI